VISRHLAFNTQGRKQEGLENRRSKSDVKLGAKGEEIEMPKGWRVREMGRRFPLPSRHEGTGEHHKLYGVAS